MTATEILCGSKTSRFFEKAETGNWTAEKTTTIVRLINCLNFLEGFMKIVVGFLLINFLVLWHSNSVVASSETEKSSTAPLETIYFESDSVDILNAGAIEENADWLKGHKSRVVILEGHCDERGDRDYNYSLGDRRARA